MKNNYNQREISLSLSVCPCVCVWGGNTALPFLFFPGCLVTIQSPHSVELCVWMLLQLKSAWEPPPLPPSMQIPPSHLFLLSSPSSISPSFSSTRCSSSSSRCLFSPSRSLSSHARLSTTERLKIAPGIPASIQKKEEEEEVWGGWGSQLTQGHPPPTHTHQSPSSTFHDLPRLTSLFLSTRPTPCQILFHRLELIKKKVQMVSIPL